MLGEQVATRSESIFIGLLKERGVLERSVSPHVWAGEYESVYANCCLPVNTNC